jgi:hypothetical protein
MARNQPTIDATQDPALAVFAPSTQSSSPSVPPNSGTGGETITRETVIVGEGNTVVSTPGATILINNNEKDTIYITEISQSYNQQYITNNIGGNGGNGTPGGVNTQLQYNANGVFGGTATATYNSTTGVLTISNLLAAFSSLGNVGNVKILGGESGQYLQTDGTGNLSWANGGGGGNGSPGGSNTQVQFNDQGSFGGDQDFTYNKLTGRLTAQFFAGDGSNISNLNPATLKVTNINSTGVYNVLSTDQVLLVQTGNSVTIQFPDVDIGRQVVVKDFSGADRTLANSIQLRCVQPGDTIDKANVFLIQDPFNTVTLVGITANQWMVM